MKIIQIQYDQLKKYSQIPITFTVNTKYDIIHSQNSSENDLGIQLIEKPVTVPYKKNYDDYESPLDWKAAWNLKWNSDKWGFFLAENNSGEAIGGASVAFKIPGMQMCDGREDLAVLWDIRIQPDHRGKGIGKLLFSEEEKFARENNCTTLKIETQNTNVSACKFYKSMGCILGKVTPHAYSEFPDESQLLFYKDLY